jgi:hypothetical protein
MHFGASMLATLWTYWQWALGPGRLALLIPGLPGWVGLTGTALLSLSLAGFVVWRVRARQWPVLLPLAWFVLTLLPVLPLRDHISAYYLTLPAAGLAWLAALALAGALRERWYLKAIALALTGVYLAAGVMGGRTETEIVVARSHAVRTLVWGAVRARELHPNKTIVFTGISSELFWTGIYPRPFRLAGISDVYLAPEAASRIQPRPELGAVSEYVIPQSTLMNLMAKWRAMVYVPEAGRLRGVTMSYYGNARREWKPEEPRRVDVGQASFARQLGPSWYDLDAGRRWMPRSATVRLGGPERASEKLYVSGYCPAPQVRGGPLRLIIAMEGARPQIFQLSKGDAGFELVVNLPSELIGRKRIDVTLEVDRTFKAPPDRRELGLSFGTFEIRD